MVGFGGWREDGTLLMLGQEHNILQDGYADRAKSWFSI